MSRSRLFVGRLPNRASERDVEHFFRGYGRIREITLKQGYGFVVSSSSQAPPILGIWWFPRRRGRDLWTEWQRTLWRTSSYRNVEGPWWWLWRTGWWSRRRARWLRPWARWGQALDEQVWGTSSDAISLDRGELVNSMLVAGRNLVTSRDLLYSLGIEKAHLSCWFFTFERRFLSCLTPLFKGYITEEVISPIRSTIKTSHRFFDVTLELLIRALDDILPQMI